MTAYKLNKGQSLSYPYESQYSLWRRLVSSNQSLKHSQLLEAIGSPVEKNDSYASAHHCFNTIIKRNFSTTKPVPAYFELFNFHKLGSKLYSAERNCPECAAIGYHCDLYRLPWVKNCPLHQCVEVYETVNGWTVKKYCL